MAFSKNIKMDVHYVVTSCFNVNVNTLDSNLENEFTKPLTLTGAYIKILNVEGSKENVKLTVGIYKDSTKQSLIYTKNYSFVPNVAENSENFIKQGYEYLKTLAEYEGAIDVLEDGQML